MCGHSFSSSASFVPSQLPSPSGLGSRVGIRDLSAVRDDNDAHQVGTPTIFPHTKLFI